MQTAEKQFRFAGALDWRTSIRPRAPLRA